MSGNRSLGVLTLDLVARIGGFVEGMGKAAREADKRMKEIEARAKKFGAYFGAALAAGATAAGAAIFKLTKDAIDSADAIRDMSIRVGASTETLSAYAYAAKQTGTDIEELGKGLLRLSKNATAALDPKSRQANLFEALLGPNFKNQIKDIETLLPAVATKFAQMEEGITKTALAQELFGKSGANLMEFLNSGGQGLDEFTRKASELGIVISQETADAADAFNDTLGDIRELANGLGVQIASALLPSLVSASEDLRDLVKEGEFANNIVGVLSGTMKAGVWIIEQYNNAVARTSIAFQVVAEAAAGAHEVMANVGWGGFFDEGSVTEGFAKIKTAFGNGQKELDALIARQNAPKAQVGAGIDFTRPAPQDGSGRETQDRMNRFFGNPTGRSGSSRGGKSEAETEAERVKKAYESLMSTMDERIALFGKEGEAARIRYEVENGALKGLDAALKQNAIARGEQYDKMVEVQELQDAADKAARREMERIQEGMTAGKELLADLQFELELMRMTNAERATAIQLRGLEAEAVAEYGAAIAEANAQIEAEMDRIQLMDGIRGEFEDFFADVIQGNKSLKDSFKDLFDNIASMITQRIAQNWVDQLFGQMGTNGAGTTGGGWLSWIAGLFTRSGGHAMGGTQSPWSMGPVNELGFEMVTSRGRDYLLTGNSPVEITPNHKLGGGGSVTQVFNNPVMSNLKTDSQHAREEARKAQREMARA